MLVIQCILAVDHFGLEIEGIYRLSGTSSLVSKLRAQFDNNPNGVDFRNPANFYHDVNRLLARADRDLAPEVDEEVADLVAEAYRRFPDAVGALSKLHANRGCGGSLEAEIAVG